MRPPKYLPSYKAYVSTRYEFLTKSLEVVGMPTKHALFYYSVRSISISSFKTFFGGTPWFDFTSGKIIAL